MGQIRPSGVHVGTDKIKEEHIVETDEGAQWAEAIRAELIEQLVDIALAGSYSLGVYGPHLQTFVPEGGDKVYVRFADGQWRAVERERAKMFDWRAPVDNT